MPSLTFYFKPTCPYCRKVTNYMEINGVSLAMKDISADPAACKELIDVGGKQQVPCLFINGTPLYESDDIIKWLEKNYDSRRDKIND